MSRMCPYCEKMVIYKNKEMWNGVIVFKSVHSECPHCEGKIVMGYKGEHGRSEDIIDDDFIIITEDCYEELTSKVKRKTHA